ncbi:SulP family inorganic anion transporter [Granulicella sp. S190]|uniref:SulP family inorganic anion transporter n=1 Tax=Granulicella sp. S190 TaxID=1747226 RepID=UPI00131C5F01|nr:SulP family inorganic anion transporter [Granulicella sp. S190]
MLTLFQGIRPLKRVGAIRDAIAGVAFAAMNIPQALGYTRIAGMPVVTGLYSLLLPLIAFAVFGSSRFLVVAADSATAAILHSGLSGMAPSASTRYVALAGLVALLTAAFLLVGRLLKLGFVADFLSQTVLVGFLTGVGFQVGIAVLGQMLGVQVTSRRAILQLVEVCRSLARVHLPTLAVTAAVLAFVFALRSLLPKAPGPMLAVILSTAASAIWNFAGHGVAIIGPVAGGLPHLVMPDVRWSDIPPLLSVAGSCAVMILTQSAATSRVYAARHHQRLDENQDLIGLSAANAAAAFSGSFVVNGSPTQTAMVESVGSNSQVAQVTTAMVVALVLLFLTKPLQYLPQCVLGTLVFLVAIRLIKLRSLRDILRESPAEFALAVTTTLVVITAGVEQGIVLAMVLSLLRIVHHSYHPRTGVMIPDESTIWKLIPPTPGAVTEPGLVLYRFGAALFYANASRFSDEILGLIGPSPTAVRWLIVDAEAITNLDYSAARVVEELKKNLADAGVELGFARLPWNTKSDFDRHHVTEAIGDSWIFRRLHDATDAFEKLESASPIVLTKASPTS